MGLLHVPVLVKAPNRSTAGYEALFLVDTGAIDSMVPASAALKAGITIDPINHTLKRLPAISLR